ncbi:MAG TPA: ferrous iron transport protein B, partial [Anaerolineae bacterium]|nr:ferrous iron transport protein B [Anaerolineae bacterium]
MSTLEAACPATFAVDYGRTLETEIDALCREIGRYPAITQKYPARWLAINLLEQDPELQQQLLRLDGGPAALTHAQMGYGRLAEIYGEDVDAVIADRRYGWIHNLVNQAVQRTHTDRYTRSDKIDRFVTHRFWGVLIFLALMWLVFKLTADLSAPYVDWIDGVLAGPVTHGVVALLTAVGLGGSCVE